MFEHLPENWNDLLKTMEDPQLMHAAIVHLPIAIAALGLVLVLGVLITAGKSPGLRWTTVFIYLLGCLAALWTTYTGEEARDALKEANRLPVTYVELEAHEHAEGGAEHEHEHEHDPDDPGVLMHRHEELAEYLWVGLAITGVLVMAASIRITWWKTLTLLLALVTAAANVAWVGVIGYYGGKMVYEHSVGVPTPHSVAPVSTDTDPDKLPPVKDKDDDGDKDATPKDETDTDKPEKDKDPGERDIKTPPATDKSIFDP